MVVVGRVVEVGDVTVRCCEMMVGSTGVLLEWSVDRRDCSQEGDEDSFYVLLRAYATAAKNF